MTNNIFNWYKPVVPDPVDDDTAKASLLKIVNKRISIGTRLAEQNIHGRTQKADPGFSQLDVSHETFRGVREWKVRTTSNRFEVVLRRTTVN